MINIFLPDLYKLPENKQYEKGYIEIGASFCFALVSSIFWIDKWIWIFLSGIIFSTRLRRLISRKRLKSFLKFFCLIAFTYCLCLLVQNVARLLNPNYKKFYSLLQSAQENPTNESVMKELSQYDFEFWALPCQYDLTKSEQGGKEMVFVSRNSIATDEIDVTYISGLFYYLFSRTIGIFIAYPGLMQNYDSDLDDKLKNARSRLIAQHGIIRIKLIKIDGHQIEAFYVDRRNNSKLKSGVTLVICSEGNAGFPEVGTPLTPLIMGYSVIGWHHPGFQGSTGMPFPEDEQKSMQCLMSFAINHLGFHQKDIILYSWSIGGYVATWGAMNYPGIKSLILDATFDSLDPLVKSFLPPVIHPFVPMTSRFNLDLNNLRQLKQYNGSVLLIRRTRDEIMSTDPTPNLQSNRGTYLLMELLKHRYPNLYTEDIELHNYLSQSSKQRIQVKESECEKIIIEYLEKNGHLMKFPSDLGKNIFDNLTRRNVLHYLASKYMQDFQAGHNNPLPSYNFKEAWKETNLLE